MGNLHLTCTNIGLYLTAGFLLVLALTILLYRLDTNIEFYLIAGILLVLEITILHYGLDLALDICTDIVYLKRPVVDTPFPEWCYICLTQGHECLVT